MSKLDDLIKPFRNGEYFEEGGAEHEEELRQLKLAILSYFKELVPEESKSDCVCDRDACWNECRKAILDAIEGETK